MPAIEGGIFLFHGRANIADASARSEHLPRLRRDVDTYRAIESVWLPTGHVAVLTARRNETVFVAAVSTALTAAEARNVAQDFGVFGGEHRGRANDVRRPW